MSRPAGWGGGERSKQNRESGSPGAASPSPPPPGPNVRPPTLMCAVEHQGHAGPGRGLQLSSPLPELLPSRTRSLCSAQASGSAPDQPPVNSMQLFIPSWESPGHGLTRPSAGGEPPRQPTLCQSVNLLPAPGLTLSAPRPTELHGETHHHHHRGGA